MASFIASALIGVSVIVFIGFLQPYLLSTQLHVADDVRGRLVSALAILQEVVALLLVPPMGHLSDRVGRRPIMVSGLLILAGGLLLYPLAENITELAAARLITAIGAAAFAATLATIAADYPANTSRGKLLTVLLITQQLAILFVVAKTAATLPHWLAARGIDAMESGHISFFLVSGLSLVGASVAFLGLKRGHGQKPQHLERPGIATSFREIFGYARSHPRFAIVLAIAFVVRGDASIVNTFFSLWAVRAAKEHGFSPAIGLETGGLLLSYLTVSGLGASLLTGWLADRVDRLTVLLVALALAATGHLLILSITDLSSFSAATIVCLVGISEASLIIAGQVLLGQEAPAAMRGAAIGFFGFFGSLGVLSINLVGGYLFDRFFPQAPFAFVGTIDLIILLWATTIRIRESPPAFP